MSASHQILRKITQFQRSEIKSMKEKFGPQCKIYKDNPKINVKDFEKKLENISKGKIVSDYRMRFPNFKKRK